jgi:HprK-related kinase A
MLDGRIPFKPLPLDHAFPFFEWGLNWCIAKYLNQYLILHGAVVEQGGCAVIVPGPPGSGKSTLCAALVNHGWRLLSDELALIRPMGRRLVPVPRPISLKNESIEVIRAFAPAAVIGPAAHDTAKGTVAHMRPPSESIARSGETASPAWIIFPRYQRGQRAVLTPRPKAGAFMEIAENAFNYNVLGVAGFRTLTQVVDECSCYDLTYGELGDALTVLSGLALRESWIEAEGYARTP